MNFHFQADAEAKARKFCEGLTQLSMDTGVAVEGGSLFMMEAEDFHFPYAFDGESNLLRGQLEAQTATGSRQSHDGLKADVAA